LGRCNYDYDEAELEGLGHQILAFQRPGLDVHVVVNNNNAEDQGLRNGRTLFRAIQQVRPGTLAPGSVEVPGSLELTD